MSIFHIMQVNVLNLKARCGHCAEAFSICQGITEVTIFGGCPEYPKNFISDDDLPQMADTAVLRFGKLLIMAITKVVN